MSTIEERVTNLENDVGVLSSKAVRVQDIDQALLIIDQTLVALNAYIRNLEVSNVAINSKLTSLSLQMQRLQGYLHDQSATAAAIWTVNHNLSVKYVNVQVYDDNDQSIDPANYTITLVSSNTFTITFGAAQAGFAKVVGT